MRPVRPRAVFVIAASVSALAVLVGMSYAWAGSEGSSAATAAPRYVQVASAPTPTVAPKTISSEVRGSDATLRDLLATVLSGMGTGSVIQDAVIGDPPPGFAADPALGLEGSNWLSLTVAAPKDVAGQAWPEWQAELVAGAFHDIVGRQQLPGILGYTLVFAYPDGTTSPASSTVIGTGRVSEAETRSVSELRPGLIARLANLKQVAHADATFLTPEGAVARVIIQTSDPRAFFAENPGTPQQLILGQPADPTLEGLYVEVDDADGPVLISAYSGRTASGAGWLRPGFPLPPTSDTHHGGASVPRGPTLIPRTHHRRRGPSHRRQRSR